VKAVINFDMPNSVETYIHRIGRTARAGRSGKSCTLIGENKRNLMKEVIKDSEKKAASSEKTQENSAMIRTRTLPSTVIAYFASKIQSLEDHVDEVLQAEAVAKMDRIAEMELTKAKNLIEHHDEIHNRPQREWYKSVERKRLTKAEMAAKAKMIAEKAGTGTHNMTRKKRRAREAVQALKEHLANGANQDDDNDEKAVKRIKMATPSAIKASAKKEKREKAKEKVKSERMSVYDEDLKLEQKLAKKKKKRLGIEAIGDSTLFDDEQHTYSKPKKQLKKEIKNDDDDDKTPNSFYNFRGFDPNQKTGKNKKKGHNSFKSKSKYKRRK
jgi:superfamily II DNA helicase RecQ